MTLFNEAEFYNGADTDTTAGGRIVDLEPDGAGAAAGLRQDDILLAVDGHPVQDVIDVHFYASEEAFDILISRDNQPLSLRVSREYGQALGVEFAHPTFDTDIRRCNNLCEFCFVLQMAPRFRRTLYIKDDDYRYSFLFGHYVTLTNLNEHDWWRIANMGLSPLYVSVHSTNLELRRRFLRNPEAPDIMGQLRWLAEHGIEVHTQLVVVPEFNDGQWLEQSIADLATLWPAVRSISVVPVGLTSHHKYGLRTHTRAEAEQILDYVHELQPRFKRNLKRNFVYATDEWYLVCRRPLPPVDDYDGLDLHENGLGMVRHFENEWDQVQDEVARWLAAAKQPHSLAYNSATLITGTLFARTLNRHARALARQSGVELRVVPVKNRRLGESITVAGLLMAEDVLTTLAEELNREELVILPRIMFDHPDGISLDNVPAQEVANRLGRPLALADLMGDVWDALLGQSAVLYYPQST